jgi:uncharacterized membrane protein
MTIGAVWVVIVILVQIYLIVLATRATQAMEQIARGMAQLNQTNERIAAALNAIQTKP